MKEKAVIFMAPYRSHVHATLKLAKVLSEKYEVVYIGTSNLRDIVVAEGHAFKTVTLKFYHPPINLQTFFTNLLNQVFGVAYDAFFIECNEILHKMDSLNPKVIFIDAFLTRYYPLLKEFDCRVLVLQTMLATNKTENIPPLCSAYIPTISSLSSIKVEIIWAIFFLKKSIIKLFFKIASANANNTASTKKFKLYGKQLFVQDTFGHPRLKDVPEIILSSIALDYPWQKVLSTQIHFGLSAYENRNEILTKEIVGFIATAKANNDNKLIYCSFGSVIKNDIKRYYPLINNLRMIAQKKSNWFFIISGTNDNYTDQSNLIFIPHAPQLTILKQADLMISHGGLNSIQECIKYEIPMLLFPFSTNSDRYGNASRVISRKIGLVGKLNQKETEITTCISTLLIGQYKDSLRMMKSEISELKEEERFNIWLSRISITSFANNFTPN